MKKIVIANWKMHFGVKESLDFLKKFKKMRLPSSVETVIAPSFISLCEVSKFLRGTKIKLGAQNVFWREKGAYTSEVSPKMLKENKVSYVIVGHSESRKWLCETDEEINKKIKVVFKNSLRPILCVGETWQERKRKRTFKIIQKQLRIALRGVDGKKSFVVAYEPVWAIGTGRSAYPDDVIKAHKFIRQVLVRKLGGKKSAKARIIYGGSVDGNNVSSFAKYPEIQGFLVGGASLSVKEFSSIIRACV